ncbi:MAG: CRISPR-associated protein Cas4 [Actinobacteria bacterium]|nr:CRISPR-associated protein Cas4 [Actinomycetota bacterium]
MTYYQWDKDEYISISAIQHFVFCERQVALIHTERVWEENIFTVEGQHIHSIADVQSTEKRGNVRIARGLFLRSSRLGIFGKADVVEFHRQFDCINRSGKFDGGASIKEDDGLWYPYPVEYKRGERRRVKANIIQLCAQALCLEEMFQTTVLYGAIYYGKSARRQEIEFDAKLRESTEAFIWHCRELLMSGVTPLVNYSDKCNTCSLIDICMPKVTGSKQDVEEYISRIVFHEAVGRNEEAT